MDDAGPAGGDSGADSDAPPPLDGVMWAAAGDAMMWKAVMHEHAALARRRTAWAAEARSDALMTRAAGEFGRAVDAHGLMDTGAIIRVVSTMMRAARQRKRASRALMRSSDLCKAAWTEQKMASEAFMRSTDPEHAAAVRTMAAGTYKHAVGDARDASRVLCGANGILENAKRLAAGAIRQLETGGRAPGGGGELAAILAYMQEYAGRAHQASEAARVWMNKTGKTVARMRRLAAAASKKSSATAEAAAAAAAAGGEGGLRAEPGVQEAEAAWLWAAADAAAADAAADAEHRGGRGARGRRPDRTA